MTSMDQDLISKVEELSRCKAIEKMKAGKLHEITYENTQQLLEILDASNTGELAVEELFILKHIKELNLTDDDIYHLMEDCDKDDSKKLNTEELHEALQQGSLNLKITLDSLSKGAKRREDNECSRADLLKFLEYEQETNEALCSLPITLLSFVLFFILVSVHLQVHTAYGMQSAIQGEVEGEGKPYLGTYVHDVPTFWEWMRTSFISAQFKSNTDKLKQYPYPGRFAVYNQIIGGTQVIKTYSSQNNTCGASGILPKIYDQLTQKCHRVGPTETTSEYFLYHLDIEQLQKHVTYLNDIDWVNHDTRQLDFTNLYYNANEDLFTDFQLSFLFQGDGFVKIVFNMESFAADPYSQWWYIVVDALYMLILTRMLYQELSEMLPRLLNGLDGFIQYWDPWNVVDWLNILLGSVSFAVWGLICSKVSNDLQDAIAQLPTKQLDEWVINNQTYFTVNELQAEVNLLDYKEKVGKVHEVSGEVAAMHSELRTITFFYSFTLMLKFFKAFQANPRLNIVVMTMSDSAVDIIHFSIVFITIFFVFSLMAHVVFGAKMLNYSTPDRAIFNTFRVLLGEFETDDMELISYWLTNIWFLVFQVLVMMILLNMLLAIVMDTYSGVVGKSLKKTIWDQSRQAVNTVRETRGHLPLLYIRCEMEDEDDKKHPGLIVNVKSLRKAFEGDKMTRDNAAYLIRKTNEYLAENEEACDLKMHDAIRLVGQVRTTVMKIDSDVQQTLGLLKKAESAPREARQNAIMAGFDPDTDAHWQERMRAYEQEKLFQPTPMITNGAPINTNVHQNQYSNVGFGAQPLTINVVQDGHPLGVPDTNTAAPLQGGSPFVASNTRNTKAYAVPTPSPLYNGGAQTNLGQNYNNFGNTGLTPLQPSVTNVSVNMAYTPPTTGTSTIVAPAMQGSGALGGMSGFQMQELIDRINSLESRNDAIFNELKTFIAQRDAWTQDRMTQVDRRCQKVEVLSDRLYTLLRDLDVQKLTDVPREVREALNGSRDKSPNRRDVDEQRGVYADGDSLVFDSSDTSRYLRQLSDTTDNPRTPTLEHADRDNHSQSGMGNATHGRGIHPQRLEERLNAMSEQLENLLSLAEETPKITSMLWRMDLNLRQLTGTAHNLPANHPLLQQQQQQQAQLAIEGNSSRYSSRQAALAMRGTNSGQGSTPASRMISKTSFLPVPEGQS
mmetsp:Transcript_83035/g.129709  ORF Transcript_83035/g.129709 Transcript_83035/m.129709 type:complete len:1179 (-) Transcript_83035:107-3643(-)